MPSASSRTALFIDGASLYATAKALGFDVDFKRLLGEFQTRGNLLRAYYYTAIIDAVARREKARFLPDGITAANQLGLTDAVPAKVTVHTDARLRPIHLDSLVINFKPTAPSRLYWAGRPAMRIVQALHWLHDMLPAGGDSILQRIRRILDDPKQGAAIRDDLRSGLDALPAWMRELVTGLLQDADHSNTTARKSFSRIAKDAIRGGDDRSARRRS